MGSLAAASEDLARGFRDRVIPPVVVVGVGHPLRGDDGVGLEVARRLAGRLADPVVEAGPAPENFLMPVTASRPGTVVLVDALRAGASPGTIRLAGPEDLQELAPGTHGPGLSTFLHALELVHPCRVVVVGVEPADTGFGRPLSPEVRRAAAVVVHGILRGGRFAPLRRI